MLELGPHEMVVHYVCEGQLLLEEVEMWLALGPHEVYDLIVFFSLISSGSFYVTE